MTPNTYTDRFTTETMISDTTTVQLENFTDYRADQNGSAYYDMYPYGGSYYYYYDDPYILKVFPFEIVALGTVRPILVFLTAIANIFVVGFFIRKKNRGNATNVLFVSIAFSDTMSGLLLVPNSFYVYMAKNDELSMDLCRTYMMLRLFFSRVFHTVSIWQTMFLGVQRYICVCHPFSSNRFCTARKTVMCIALFYVLATSLHVFHVFDDKVSETPPRCKWQQQIPCVGMCIYLWVSVAFQHLTPCIILATLTWKTIQGLRLANRRISAMSQTSMYKRASRERTITITSIIVVIVFLIPEMPHGLYKLVLAIRTQEGIANQQTLTNHIIMCVYELSILASFHANFWIYCSMMNDFRQICIKIATCNVRQKERRRLRTNSGSQSSRKGSVGSTTRSSTLNRTRLYSQTLSVHSNVSETNRCEIQMYQKEYQRGQRPSTPGDKQKRQNDDDVFV